MTEVVVTLNAPALTAFGRSLTSARACDLRPRARGGAGGRRSATCSRRSPSAQVRWRYRIVANGFALVVPSADVGRCSRTVPGVAKVWPNVDLPTRSASGRASPHAPRSTRGRR